MKVDVDVAVLDLLFPPTCVRCGVLLVREDETPLCTRCHSTHASLPIEARRIGRIDALYPYDSPIGDALKRLKFGGEMGVAGPIGRLLSGASILYESPGGHAWDLLCAVPLHPTRRWIRGFDQAHLLAHWALHYAQKNAGDGLPRFEARLLERTRATVAQTELNAAERLANLRGAFRVRHPRRVRGASVLIIDDVTTTGATLHACFDALRRAGARHVAGLCVARSLQPSARMLPSLSA